MPTAAEWSTEHFARWEGKIALEAPLRDEQFQFLVDFLPLRHDAQIRVLDLGAGPGALARAVLERFPAATVILLDWSADALGLAAERLAAFGPRAQFVEADLSQPGWAAALTEPLDAVVSSQVVHMLPDERKREVYAEIAACLRPGGWLLNLDHVAIPDEALRERYWRVRVEQVRRLREQATGEPASFDEIGEAIGRSREFSTKPYADLFAQLGWLREAGFVEVDCYWKRLGLALFGGRRPDGE